MMKDFVEYTIFMCIFALALLLTNSSATTPKNNVLLGLTLPGERLKDSRVLSIIKKYKRASLLVIGLFILGIIPIYFIKYPSILFLYLCIWLIAILAINSYVLYIHRQSLYMLKVENQWLTESKHMVNVDTKVAMLKEKMPINKLVFIPCLLIPIIAMLIRFMQGADTKDILFNLWSFVIIGFNYIIYRKISNGSSVVYSEDTNMNQVCNRIYIRIWTGCWTLVTYIATICFAGFSFFGFAYSHSNYILIAFIGVISVSTYITIFLARNKVKFSQEQLLAVSGSNTHYVNDDEFWMNGFYNNPNDKRWAVERRIGNGLDFNTATVGGKVILFSIALLLFIVLAVVFIGKFKMDFMI